MKKSYFYFKFYLINYLIISSLSVFSQNNTDKTLPDYEQAYKQAINFFNENKPKEGYDWLSKAIGTNPTYYDALYARSYYRMQDAEYASALRDYDLLLLLYPEDTLLYLYRGQAKVALERYEEAEADYMEAYQRDTAHTEVLNALGSLYFVMDLYDDALIYLNKSLKIKPKEVFPHYYRAYTYYQQRKYDLAGQDIATCQSIDPKDVDSQRLKAIVLLAQKKYKESIVIFEELQKRNIDFQVDDFYHWGLAYYEQRKYQDALFYFDLPEKPQSADIYYYRGRTKFLLNKLKEAQNDLDSAIVLYNPDNEESAKAFYDRSVVKHKLKNLLDAEKDYLRACYLLPEIAFQKDQNGNLLSLLGDAYNLLKMSQKSKILDSVRVKGYQDRTEGFISEGDTNLALKEINKAIKVDSLHSFSHTLRGTVRAMLTQYQPALQDLQRAERLNKGRVSERVFYIKSLVFNALGNFSEAKVQLEKALELNKNEPSYWSDLANIHFELNDFGTALQNLDEAIKLAPNELDYWADRALYLASNKEYEKAIEDCNRVIRVDKENVMIYYYRGLAHQGLKKYPEAVSDFSQVLAAFPEDLEISNLLKDALDKMERQKKK
jgi:tetratricopeptide (TPR) repeat protein